MINGCVSFFKLRKMQKQWGKSTPYDSAAWRTTFSSNKLLFLYDFISLSRRCGWILAHNSLKRGFSSGLQAFISAQLS